MSLYNRGVLLHNVGVRRGSAENSHPNRGADPPQDLWILGGHSIILMHALPQITFLSTRKDMGAKNDSGVDRARQAWLGYNFVSIRTCFHVNLLAQAFEEEKARKAAALERARRPEHASPSKWRARDTSSKL